MKHFLKALPSQFCIIRSKWLYYRNPRPNFLHLKLIVYCINIRTCPVPGRNFKAFVSAIERYQNAESVQFYNRDSRMVQKIRQRTQKKFNERIKCHEISLFCIHGGENFKARETGVREQRLSIYLLHVCLPLSVSLSTIHSSIYLFTFVIYLFIYLFFGFLGWERWIGFYGISVRYVFAARPSHTSRACWCLLETMYEKDILMLKEEKLFVLHESYQ